MRGGVRALSSARAHPAARGAPAQPGRAHRTAAGQRGCAAAVCSCAQSAFHSKVRKETKRMKGRKRRQRSAARRPLGTGTCRFAMLRRRSVVGIARALAACFQFRRFTTLLLLIPFSTVKEHKAQNAFYRAKDKQRNATIQNPSQSASGLG